MGMNEFNQLDYILKNPSARQKSVALFNGSRIYYHYPVKHPYEKNKISTMSAYNISVLHHLSYKTQMKRHRRPGEYILIDINETVHGVHSLGGSNFRVEMRGYENTICSTQDYLTGKYRVRCPPLQHCASITVTLMYLNFDAFVVKHQITLDEIIYQRRWCPIADPIRAPHDCASQKRNPPVGRGLWVNETTQWKWLENGCPVTTLSNKESKTCLNNLHSIHLVGDSHIRYMSLVFLAKMRRLPRNLKRIKWTNYRHGRFYFWWTDHAPKTEFIINELRKKFRQVHSSRDVLLVSTGAWDMMIHGAKHYMQTSERTMLKSLKRLKNDPRWSNARLLYVNNVVFPPKQTLERFEIGYRSTFNLAAVNYWLHQKLAGLGITVVDAFSLVNFRYEENVCGNHYLCSVDAVRRSPAHMEGTVGFTVADVVFSHICNF